MSSLNAALQKVRLVIFDIDGVFTDGTLISNSDGSESKAFHVHDGQGVKYLMACGIKTAVITGRTGGAVEHRASELGIQEIFIGENEKLNALDQILSNTGIQPPAVAYVGDDLPDIPVMARVGAPLAVANARAEVKEWAIYVSDCSGGKGAVREICELILKAQGQWEKVLRRYLDDQARP